MTTPEQRLTVIVSTPAEMWAALTDDNVAVIQVADLAAMDGIKAMTNRTTAVSITDLNGNPLTTEP